MFWQPYLGSDVGEINPISTEDFVLFWGKVVPIYTSLSLVLVNQDLKA